MAGASREISSVMTSAANNYNTRLYSSVRIKTRIRTEVTYNRIRANAQNSGNYEIRDNNPYCAPRHVIYYSLSISEYHVCIIHAQKVILFVLVKSAEFGVFFRKA